MGRQRHRLRGRIAPSGASRAGGFLSIHRNKRQQKVIQPSVFLYAGEIA